MSNWSALVKGTILDFLKLASEKPELAQQLVDLAAKHDFEFSDELNDEQLEGVAGGSYDTDNTQDLAIMLAKLMLEPERTSGRPPVRTVTPPAEPSGPTLPSSGSLSVG